MGENVLRAARQLWESEGCDAVTMRRVSGQLRMSAMGLYGYFDGKEQLVSALLEEGFSEPQARIKSAGTASGYADFAHARMSLLSWMLESGTQEQWRLVLSEVSKRRDTVLTGRLIGLGFLRVRGLLSSDEFVTALNGSAVLAAA